MDNKKSIVAVLVILIFVLVGVLALKSFYEPVSNPSLLFSPSPSLADSVAEQNARDEQRIKDIAYLSEQIESYNNNNLGGLIFVASEWQKISDGNSPIFNELKNYGYMEKPLNDPLGDKYYYGYRAAQSSYELSVFLENKNNSKCEMLEDQCFYIVKKEMAPRPTNSFEEDFFENESEVVN
jgi:hypothetical protein